MSVQTATLSSKTKKKLTLSEESKKRLSAMVGKFFEEEAAQFFEEQGIPKEAVIVEFKLDPTKLPDSDEELIVPLAGCDIYIPCPVPPPRPSCFICT